MTYGCWHVAWEFRIYENTFDIDSDKSFYENNFSIVAPDSKRRQRRLITSQKREAGFIYFKEILI